MIGDFLMAGNQAYLFLMFVLNGVFIAILFDFFRILRKTFKTKNMITYIEDVLFWIITGLSIIFSMYKFSDRRITFIYGFRINFWIYNLYINIK